MMISASGMAGWRVAVIVVMGVVRSWTPYLRPPIHKRQ
jgi:hypothetical protein